MFFPSAQALNAWFLNGGMGYGSYIIYVRVPGPANFRGPCVFHPQTRGSRLFNSYNMTCFGILADDNNWSQFQAVLLPATFDRRSTKRLRRWLDEIKIVTVRLFVSFYGVDIKQLVWTVFLPSKWDYLESFLAFYKGYFSFIDKKIIFIKENEQCFSLSI